MTATHVEYITQLLQQEIVDAAVAPGASACVAVRHSAASGHTHWATYVGSAGNVAHDTNEAVTPNTPFDLASVTKPVVAFTCGRAAELGRLSLTAPLECVLPWTRATPTGSLELEALLAHRAGLEAHVPLYAGLPAEAPDARTRMLERAAQARRKDAQGAKPLAGFAPIYSDLGYLLAGAALETALAVPLDEAVAATLANAGISGLASARLHPASRCAAATEVNPERGGLIRGAVHDDNAWFAYGSGCAGHAGLFGTAQAVADFGCMMLDLVARRGNVLSPNTLDLLLRERAGGTLRAGFDGVSQDGTSSAGTVLGARSFGHLGFTGTSLWCDPEAEIVVVLLTNRVCPTRENLKIRQARPRVHDALASFARRA